MASFNRKIKEFPASHWLLAIAIVVITLQFIDLLFDSSRTFLYRDFIFGLLPSKFFIAKSIKHQLVLPFWNQFLYAGAPYFEDFKTGVLYPLNVFFLLFPIGQFTLAMNWFVYAHHLLMFAGMFFFVRIIGFPKQAQVCLALLYALSGVAITTNNLISSFSAMWILPFFMLYLHKVARTARSQSTSIKDSIISFDSICLAFFLGLPVISSAIETSYFFGLIILAYLLFYRDLKFTAAIAFSVVVSLGIFAVQWLPGVINLLSFHGGITGRDSELATNVAFHPWRVIGFFLSNPFGNPSLPDDSIAALYSRANNKTLYIFSTYLSSLSILGFVCFFFSSYRFKRILFVSVALALAATMGNYSFVDIFSGLRKILPFFELIRHPEKILVFVNFLFVIMIGQGLIWFIQRFIPRERAWIEFIIGMSSSALALLFFYLFRNDLPAFKIDAVYFFSFSLFLFFVCVFVLRVFKKESFLWAFVLFFLSVDLLLNAKSLRWDQKTSLLFQQNVVYIKEDLRSRSEEILQGAAFRYSSFLLKATKNQYVPKYFHLKDPIAFAVGVNNQKLLSNSPLFFGIHDVHGEGILLDKNRLYYFIDLFNRNPWRFFDLTGVYYFGKNPTQILPRYHVDIRPNTVMPYVFVPANILFYNYDKPELLNRISSPDFNPREEVYFANPKNNSSNNASLNKGPYEQKNIPVRVRRMNNQKVELRFPYLPKNTFISINESYHRFWNASINGKKVPMWQTNGWSMGIKTIRNCKSNCIVTLEYKNPYVFYGFMITIVSVVLLILFGRISLFRSD